VIALLSKNSRAGPLFKLLQRDSTGFVNLGIATVSLPSKLAACMCSVHAGIGRTKLDAQFSPIYCMNLQHSCQRLLRGHDEISAVLYWGATNLPTNRLPYFIISDGPFDPSDPIYPTEWRPQRWATNYLHRQRVVYGRAEHVFTLSRWAANKIMRVHGLPPDKVTPIGWGPLHSAGLNLAPAQPHYFVSIGSPWLLKGMEALAAAADCLHKTNPDCTVVLAGASGGLTIPERPGLRVIPHSIPPDEAQKLISNARALLLASRFDASPHVIMEALQAGTPVIASRVCGIPEAVTHETGHLVGPGDVQGFVSAMRACLQEDVLQQRTRTFDYYHNVLGGWEKAAQIVAAKIAAST
jgi:glycosyltransferase involved in cell wall biosynthesis